MKKSELKSLIKEGIKETLITERFININSKEEMEKYIDKIWDMMQRTYSYLDGGFATASSPEELIRKTHYAKLVKKNDTIIAAALYKDSHGRKGIAKGSDGTKEGLMAVKQIYVEDMKFNRAWGELSGKAESFALKNGGIPVPNTMAAELLGKEIKSLNPDGFHYTREIGGADHEKIIVGNVNKEVEK